MTLDGCDERKLHRPAQPDGRLYLPRISAEAPQHQVGQHNRNADRHERLANVLSFHAPEDRDLQDDADEGGDDKSHDEAQEPRAGRIDRQVAEIPAQEIDRAMCEIDIAQQAED
jgi:hypothetical protein